MARDRRHDLRCGIGRFALMLLALAGAVTLAAASPAAAQDRDAYPDRDGSAGYSGSDPGRDPPGNPGSNPGSNPGGTFDYSEFHQALDPHGEWIDHPRFGSAWVPKKPC